MSDLKCIWISSDHELRLMSQSLIMYARNNPMNREKHAEMLEQIEERQTRQEISSENVTGYVTDSIVPIIGEYSTFFTFSMQNIRPLQITYMEYEHEDEFTPSFESSMPSIENGNSDFNLAQLTICSLNMQSLNPGDVSRLKHFFFDKNKKIDIPGLTPPHVLIYTQKVKNVKQWMQ